MLMPHSRFDEFSFPQVVALVCLTLMLLVSCGGSEGSGDGGESGGDGNPDGNSVATDGGAAAEVYARLNCAECHGPDGEGTDTPRTEIAGHRLIIQQFQTRIRNGRGSAMPGYGADQISDEEIQALYDWLKGQ